MYKADILGGGFEQMTLRMKPDGEGEVVSTLIRAQKPERQSSILYLHGFSDYFFQKEMGERFIGEGYNFYALDLRKCGRSLRAGQRQGNVRNIGEYYEDIDAAIAQIKRETSGNLILLGHSTGGLILSVYLNDRAENHAAALILNSPFLAMNTRGLMKKLLPVVSIIALFFPNMKIRKGLSSNYGKSIAKRMYGEWEFDENLKPLAVSFVYASWLKTVNKAHSRVRNGLNVKCPVLVMCSDKSFKSKLWSEEFRTADAVLAVNDIMKYSVRLGKNVTKVVINNGLHDLILSAPAVRENAYKEMFEFLKANLPVN